MKSKNLALGVCADAYRIQDNPSGRTEITIAIGVRCSKCGKQMEIVELLYPDSMDISVSPCKNCCKEDLC